MVLDHAGWTTATCTSLLGLGELVILDRNGRQSKPPAPRVIRIDERVRDGWQMRRGSGVREAVEVGWWAMLDLNQRPPACEAGALPLS